jgi:hypothetical protein
MKTSKLVHKMINNPVLIAYVVSRTADSVINISAQKNDLKPTLERGTSHLIGVIWCV